MEFEHNYRSYGFFSYARVSTWWLYYFLSWMIELSISCKTSIILCLNICNNKLESILNVAKEVRVCILMVWLNFHMVVFLLFCLYRVCDRYFYSNANIYEYKGCRQQLWVLWVKPSSHVTLIPLRHPCLVCLWYYGSRLGELRPSLRYLSFVSYSHLSSPWKLVCMYSFM